MNQTAIRIERAAFQTREAAAYIGVSVITLKRLVYRGLITPNRATQRLLFPKTQLDAFLADPRIHSSHLHQKHQPQIQKRMKKASSPK